jgi:hypothetical protein
MAARRRPSPSKMHTRADEKHAISGIPLTEYPLSWLHDCQFQALGEAAEAVGIQLVKKCHTAHDQEGPPLVVEIVLAFELHLLHPHVLEAVCGRRAHFRVRREHLADQITSTNLQNWCPSVAHAVVSQPIWRGHISSSSFADADGR